MTIRTPRLWAAVALMIALLAVLARCNPGGSDDCPNCYAGVVALSTTKILMGVEKPHRLARIRHQIRWSKGDSRGR